MQCATGEQQAHSYRTGYSCTEKTNPYSKIYPAVLPACLFTVVVSKRNFFLLRLASQGILDLGVFVVKLRMYEAEGVALNDGSIFISVLEEQKGS